ncbi:MAG TPA: hypothetical protein VLD59_10650 [Steroidobacteraceae bacterium]|nr:hypothetical protein [Steroidobacteraceae bacterium]
MSASAADAEWTLLLEPMYMDAYGHDQHVMTFHELDLDPALPTDTATPVTLDNEAGIGYRFEVQYARWNWTLGLDFFWFDASQGRPRHTAAASAPAGAFEQVIFETAGRTAISDSPAETLLFEVLEDTDIAAWTVDLYATKALIESADAALQLQLGLRNADFDNDFHSVVAIENVSGSLVDASSNYDRMIGPLIGLSGRAALGRSTLRGYIGQSVVFGSVQLSHMTRDFLGPVSMVPNVVAQETFGKDQDVAIPITEFRVNWLYPLSSRVALGLSANTSVWWDVPVPPGIPVTDGDRAFQENTIVYFGLAFAVRVRI